jgi:thiamine-monophosphate kinase
MARMSGDLQVPAGATLADVGEFGVVRALAALFEQGEQVLLGPGDDAAVVAVPDGRVVVSTDLHVDTRHFRRDWASALDIGHKVAAANLSDLNAMGGVATALTVGLAAPADTPASWALDLARGIAEECALVGASVVGGDLTGADQVMVSVTALGAVAGDPVRRSGARAGDVVAIAGRQGWAAGGLAVLTRGFRSPRALVEAYKRPQPPYGAGPEAAAAGATSMIDVSDGLLADVGHIASASGVAVDVATAGFKIAEPMQAVGAALGADPMRFLLAGGDDHALVATFPAGATLPAGWTRIGEVHEGEGVTVDGSAYDGPTGHVHF